METNDNRDKLNRYEFDDQILYTGFENYQDAENYLSEYKGKLVEVAFKDGNDNPVLSTAAGLIEKKLHYFVDAGPEYKFIHSTDPSFKEYADELQKMKADFQKLALDERYIMNFEAENTEDPIIVLKNNQLESVTSRERSKYLKHATVYELGVYVPK